MSAACPSCGCHQPEGLLCHDDTAAVETMLAAVPQLIDQLDIAISKQARVAAIGVAPRSRTDEDDGNEANLKHTRSPINWGIVAARDNLVIEAAFIGEDIPWLRRHPQAGEMVSSFGRAVKNAYAAIDRARDRQYLGQCSHILDNGEPCYEELWVKPGANQSTCRACKYTHDVPKRRAQMLEDAEDLIVTPREASQFIGDIGGIPVGHQRIRNYVDRKRIAARPSVDGMMRLRLGDLLTVILDENERRSA